MNYNFVVFVIILTLQFLVIKGDVNCTYSDEIVQRNISYNDPTRQQFCIFARTNDDFVFQLSSFDTPGDLKLNAWPDSKMNECVQNEHYKTFLKCNFEYCNEHECILGDVITPPPYHKWDGQVAEGKDAAKEAVTDASTANLKSSNGTISGAACDTIISTAKDLASSLMNTLSNIGKSDGDGTTNGTGTLLPSNSSKTGTGGQTGPGSSSVLVNPDGTNTGNSGTSGQGQHNNQNGQFGQSSSSNNNHSGSSGANPSITGSGDNSQLSPNAIRYLPITQNTCDCKCNHSSEMNTIVKQSASSINVMMATFLTLSAYLL